MSKTLIAYGTRKGITAHAAEIISLSLKDNYNLNVDVVDLKKTRKIDLNQYENVILGSSIAIGKWSRHAKKFLKKDFTGKKLFIYVSSALAGEGIQNNDTEKYNQAIKQYIEDVIIKYP
ncbi:MAG: flavodoxin domain-containing protein, partial [Candidatus Thorarchaeota archaeon]